jgi:hypothetical protein
LICAVMERSIPRDLAGVAQLRFAPVYSKSIQNKATVRAGVITLVDLVMSTIPKRKDKRSDIEANYRNETKTF